MARPPSWLPRLHQLRQTIANSVRSHYDRKDIERLFELQPRASGKLLELLPTVPVGTAHLVEREVLSGFLDRVHQAKDVTALFEQLRSEKSVGSRRRLRSLVRRDLDPVSLASLPDSIALSRGRLEISFLTVEQLAEAMLTLARILESEGEAFVEAYEPRPLQVPRQDRTDINELFAELEALENQKAQRESSPNGS